ncbi:MAG TPA: right-handed parallel beta-helix repeat-containing protein [Solirubrobacterales bacterium]|nr:right-handed parallel beta-helix repeat-containing protein [Solirubrobacterales bacterium]
MTFRPRVALTLLAALLALALPAIASAAVYEVDSTVDEEAISPVACLTAGGKCSLRAAIEAANATIGVHDEITFSAAFDGQLADTIALVTPLPGIEDPVSILGGDCFGEDGPDAPCAGIEGPSTAAALTVESSDGVVIEGLSITGAQFGIVVVGGSKAFTVRDSWIGLKLNAAENGNVIGIFLDPGSDGATIGGVAASARNVIAGNDGDGLYLNGASHATIQGNYFGVNPPGPVGLPGGSQEMANGKDIEITDSTAGGGVEAKSNEIGATIEGAALASEACDGGCNVISGAVYGIDLQGDGAGQNEAPATGSTFIKGNFVGLDAGGTGVVPNSTYGIYAGGADHVTVGGSAAGTANYVAGGSEGIASGSDGEDFVVRGNRIGFGSDGSEVTPPATTGIFTLPLGVSEEPTIENNVVRMAGGIGIESRFETGHITGNEIEGGSIGIWTKVGEGAGLIASNSVEAAGEYGILVESPDNEVRANEVIGSGLSGIRVKNPKGVAMTGNLIGGNTAEKENVVEGSGGPAIEIFEEAEEAGSWTEITRNHGSGNSGLFIDLKAGANEEIKPPAVSTALQSSATGTALPGATIRVFSKAGPELGELGGFLAETEADGSGNWKVGYATLATGTLVTANQTNALHATSELATAVPAAADPSGGGGGCNDALPAAQCAAPACPASTGCQGPILVPVPPDTKITKAPKAKSSATTAKFKFKSTVAGSSFECKLDKGRFKKCPSPKTYQKLKPGKHVFKVRAIDRAGNVDPTPAKRSFKVVP